MLENATVLTWFLGGFTLDVEEQLAFYGAYHSHPVNQLIHVIFVPVIWFSAIVGLAYSPRLYKGAPHWANWSLVVFLLYAGYYMVLDFTTALIVDAFYLGLFMLANNWVQNERTKQGANAKPAARPGTAAKIAFGLHVLGWYAQIHPGHMIFEGRKPALLDSFVQSLVLAPLFVFYEVIWAIAPGYKAEMHANVMEMIRVKQQQSL